MFMWESYIDGNDIENKDQTESLVPPASYKKTVLPRATDRAYRRRMHLQKDARLRKIITRHYMPHAGYLMPWDATHIRYPRSRKARRWIKRSTSKMVRKADIRSGNQYRKVFDYWWTLY